MSINTHNDDLQQKQVDLNYEAFKKQLPNLLKTDFGKFALMRDGAIIEFFNDFNDAERAGRLKYEDGLFSIQKIDNTTIQLGMFAYA